MTEQLTRKQMRKALQKCRFPKHGGWRVRRATTSSLVAINARESLGPVTIAMIGVTAKVPPRADQATREATLCTALGQLLLTMREQSPTMSWAIAAPNTEAWLETLERIPLRVLATFRLTLMLVDEHQVIEYPSPYEYDERGLLDGEDLSDLVLPEGAEDEIDAMLGDL